MRKLEFVEPNFICKAKDSDGNVYEKLLFHFDSEAELKSYLEEQTLTLVSAKEYVFKDKWLKKAQEAADLANDAKNKEGFEYDNAVWSELKQFLFAISHGKCGYCEQRVKGVYAGDVEHYRPKKKVTEDSKHPGYYWLAYDPSNYVPVCQNCNGARAKANHFPLEPGSERALSPADDISKERPLLINPLGGVDPSTQFEFVGPEGGKEDFGKVRGKSPAGDVSREIYHLNRPELVTARREAYQSMTIHKEMLAANWKVVAEQWKSDWKLGIKEFTLVIMAVLNDWYNEIREKEKKNHEARIKEHEERIEQEKLQLKLLEEQLNNELLMLKG